MTKIAFVCASLGSGGAERVISILANEFSKREYDVTIVMVHNGGIYYELSDKVHTVSLDCINNNGESFVKRYFTRLKKIRNSLLEINPDVIVSFLSEINMDVCFSMLGKKIPIIVSERNDPAIDPKSKIKQILRKIAYCKPSGFVFQTEDAQNYFSKSVRKRSTIILNPLSGNIPEPYDGEKEKRVVSVGRLYAQKNYPMLLEAFSEFSKTHIEYHLDIYGEGILMDSLQTMAEEKGIKEKVTFHGFCFDVHNAIRNAEMFVMSSDFEGLPNALIEAMAIGLPCISTDCPCGGPRMLIENYENGLLVSVGDSAALAKEMSFIADNPQKAAEMGRSASLIKEKLEVSKIVDEWLKYIHDRIK